MDELKGMEMDTKQLLKLMSHITNLRHFEKQLIKEDDLKKLFAAFSYGHSSIGNQARELIVLDNQTLRERMISCTLSPYLVNEKGNQSWLKDVPFIGLIVIESRRARVRVGDAGVRIAEREAEGALTNFRLVAATLGIGTTVVREFDSQKLKEALRLPWYLEVASIIAAGYSAEIGRQTQSVQFPVSKIIHKDGWT